MSDHKMNRQALLAATFPNICGTDENFSTTILTSREAIPGVVLMTKEEIAENVRRGDDGGIELRDPETGEWKPQPPEVEVHELGAPLPPEKVMLVFHLATFLDIKDPGIVTLAHRKPRTRRQLQVIGTIGSVNLGVWQAMNHQGSGEPAET
jgi:hypothetical protein